MAAVAIENSNSGSGFPFPDEFAPPKKKAKDEYGLQAARAMYFSRNRYGFNLYSQVDSQITALIELAQGRMSTDNLRTIFGYGGSDPETSKDDTTLAFVDIQTINLATKYVNRTVAKLQRYKYKIGLSAADPISVDEAKEHDAKVKTYYQLKGFYETMGQQAQQFFEDLAIDQMPEYPEELLFNMQVNPKIRKIMDGEKTIQVVNTVINDMGQILREVDWDQVVVGRSHIHAYLDENKMPKAQRINPKFWGGSYVDNEDFRKQEYSFFIEFITKNQFKKEAEGKLSVEEINTVLKSNAHPNIGANYGTIAAYGDNWDGLEYIPVMRFYFLSNDNKAYATWKSPNTGNFMMDERHYNYKPRGEKEESDVIRNTYTTVYGGTWVVDSPTVYNYGPKDIPRSNLVDTRLPIITFAANMKDGRYVSMLSQMIEPLTMFNVAWNKVKEALAKGRLGLLKVNFTAFENIALGKGGQQWTPRQAVDFLFKTNIAVAREITNMHGQKTSDPVAFESMGITIADYFNTMQQCIMILNDLSSSAVTESNDMPDRLTTKTMMANVESSNDGIEYLVNAHTQMYYQATHMLLLLTQEAKRNKAAIKGMIPALGKSTTEFFEVPDELPYVDYGLTMEREATEEEWAEFYAEVAQALANKQINASDSAYIREFGNMTMARYILAQREMLNEKKMAKQIQEEREFQKEIATMSSDAKLQAEMQIMAEQDRMAKENMQLQAKIDEYLMRAKADLDGELNNTQLMVQERIKKQEGVMSVLKESLRSKSEDNKSATKSATDLATTNIQAQASTLQKAMDIKAKPKPTTAKKK
jgi:hypothetical protein